MSDATTDETTTADETPKATKPPVLDSREEGKQVSIELGMRVKLVGDQDKDDEGKPKFGTVTGLEYQRQRCVVKVDDQEKLIVRPAAKVFVVKTKAGKIERVERAVRAGRKAKDEQPAAEVEVPAEVEVTTDPTEVEDAPAPL